MKANLRLGDRDAINANLWTPEQKENEQTGELEYTGGMKLDTSRANVATLARVIVAWGGEGFETNGKIDPIDLDTVAGLFEDDAKELLSAIAARNPKPIGPKVPTAPATPDTSTSAS
jgi:hypothetical protein